jgi:hypothetical protein
MVFKMNKRKFKVGDFVVPKRDSCDKDKDDDKFVYQIIDLNPDSTVKVRGDYRLRIIKNDDLNQWIFDFAGSDLILATDAQIAATIARRLLQ